MCVSVCVHVCLCVVACEVPKLKKLFACKFVVRFANVIQVPMKVANKRKPKQRKLYTKTQMGKWADKDNRPKQ